MMATADSIQRHFAASRTYLAQHVEGIRHASAVVCPNEAERIWAVAELVKEMGDDTIRGMLLTALVTLAQETDWSAT